MILKMLFAHILGDFILTSEAMSRYKNRHIERKPGIPRWGYWLTAHAALHSGLMYMATGSYFAAGYILLMHWLIDYAKCDKKITADQDQAAHVACIIFLWITEILT